MGELNFESRRYFQVLLVEEMVSQVYISYMTFVLYCIVILSCDCDCDCIEYKKTCTFRIFVYQMPIPVLRLDRWDGIQARADICRLCLYMTEGSNQPDST